MSSTSQHIVIIGTGNVATQLTGWLLKHTDAKVAGVVGRNKTSLATFKQTYGVNIFNQLDEIPPCDIIILAVSDASIQSVSDALPQTQALVVHTSGITNLNILSKHPRRGVFYPLQTMSKVVETDFSHVPILIESNHTNDTELLKNLARQFSNHIVEIHSEQRQHVHVAAVFANNFSNHLYHIASQILEQQGLDMELLKPLILETARKVQTQLPHAVQTGPAKRNDMEAMVKHVSLLTHFPEFQHLYKEISQSILLHSNHPKD
jgi:predicted short-subunit dehydrogenase-like oxidoreductase (DUF2520 family)